MRKAPGSLLGIGFRGEGAQIKTFAPTLLFVLSKNHIAYTNSNQLFINDKYLIASVF